MKNNSLIIIFIIIFNFIEINIINLIIIKTLKTINNAIFIFLNGNFEIILLIIV
jgi:hypothetical protein